jgi:hypothetical protein
MRLEATPDCVTLHCSKIYIAMVAQWRPEARDGHEISFDYTATIWRTALGKPKTWWTVVCWHAADHDI